MPLAPPLWRRFVRLMYLHEGDVHEERPSAFGIPHIVFASTRCPLVGEAIHQAYDVVLESFPIIAFPWRLVIGGKIAVHAC